MIEGARKEEPLPLTARFLITDQCVVIRHRHDLGVDARDGGALAQPRNIDLWVKESDVLGDRAGQQVVRRRRGVWDQTVNSRPS